MIFTHSDINKGKEKYKEYPLLKKPYFSALNFIQNADGSLNYGYAPRTSGGVKLNNVPSNERTFAVKLNGEKFFVARNSSKQLVKISGDGTHTTMSETAFDAPCCVRKTTRTGAEILFVSSASKVVAYNGSACKESVLPPFVDLSDFCGAVASIPASNRRSVYVTGTLDSEAEFDLNGSVCISLPVDASGLYAVNDVLYIFCRREIYKVTAGNERGNYKLEFVCDSGSEFVENSLVIVHGKAVFLTKDGLRSFDGNKVVKNGVYYGNEDRGLMAVTCFNADGLYVARVYGKFVYILYYDADNDCGGIIYNCSDTFAETVGDEDMFYVKTNTEIRQMARKTTENAGVCARTYKLNFGNERFTVCKVYTKGKNAEFCLDGQNGSVKLPFKDGGYTNVRLTGKAFDVTISNLQGDCKIENITLYVKEN